MSELHEALTTLGPTDFADVPLDGLDQFLLGAFSNGQLIIDSVPRPASSSISGHRTRANTSSHGASSESNISISSTSSLTSNSVIQSLQKEWKPVKLNAKDNPLGIGVYKLGSKDGKGAWFARRSVHQGFSFKEWKRALQKEFSATMKVQGGPGEGNIRGIGGERKVESKDVEGVGKMEVYLLSAQFPGPTAARDFVTMFLTSDQVPVSHWEDGEALRHFMVVSRPCLHNETGPRDGYVRGQYESVEYIRELPVTKPRLISASTTELNGMVKSGQSSTFDKSFLQNDTKRLPRDIDGYYDSRAASENNLLLDERRFSKKNAQFEAQQDPNTSREDLANPGNEDEADNNPIEWIMVTRSDPGGSVPRFMVERGTPGGIVSDATKFLAWVSSGDFKDFESDDETSGEIEGGFDTQRGVSVSNPDNDDHLDYSHANRDSEKVRAETDSLGASASLESAVNTPNTIPVVATEGTNGLKPPTAHNISNQLSTPRGVQSNIINSSPSLQHSNSFATSLSSDSSFASAVEVWEDERDDDTGSGKTTEVTGVGIQDRKTLKKLDMKKKKLDEKLSKTREKETKSKNDDKSKREEAIRKAEEKHRKEIEKLDRKKDKEIRKAEEKKRKADERDERARILRELEDIKAEVSLLKKEREDLRVQVNELKEVNKALGAKMRN